MLPETSHLDANWRLLNQRQVEEAKLREQEEIEANRRLKAGYRDELTKLIEQKKRRKSMEEQREKQHDHHLVERTMDIHQKNFEIQQLRQQQLNQINQKIDKDNEAYENLKRQRDMQMRQFQNHMIETNLKQSEEERRREQAYEEERKMRLRQQINESLQIKDLIRRRQRMSEAEYDRQMVKEQQKIMDRIDGQRNKYLIELKIKASQEDPHHINNIYRNIHNKSVEQHRREEVETLRDAISIEQHHKQILQEDRLKRLYMQNRYRYDLKGQMMSKQMMQRQDRQYETNSDRAAIQLSMNLQRMEAQEQKRQELIKKQEYSRFLQRQADELKGLRQQQAKISPLQIKLNKAIIEAEPQPALVAPFIPGSLRSIDYDRKRQLSILQKSVGKTDRVNQTISYDDPGSYFRQNGRRMLQ